MLRTLWDAAARLDPTVVGRDEATMPVGRPGGLLDLWQRSDLEDVDGSRVTVSTDFVDFDDYWEPFLQGQGPAGAYVAGLPDAARAALRDEVAATLGPGPFDLSRHGLVGARHRARPDGIRRATEASRKRQPTVRRGSRANDRLRRSASGVTTV